MIAQANDSYYIKMGLEYVAYTNLQKAEEHFEAAEEGLEDFNNRIDAITEDYENAKYEKTRANNATEFDKADKVYQDAKEKYDTLKEKGRIS